MKYKFNKCLEEYNKIISTDLDNYVRYSDNIHTADLINKSLNLFQVNNLPETIKPRYIEKILFTRGKGVLFKDETKGMFFLPFSYKDGLNVNGEFTHVTPLSYNGESFGSYEIGQNCVIFRDNWLEVPPIIYSVYFGDLINELYVTRQKNNNFLKLPFIFKSTGDRGKDSKNALQIKNLLYADDNELAVITDAFNELQLFDLKPQYFGMELEEQIRVLKNNYLEFLGIDHIPFDKKERLIQAEVEEREDDTSLNLQKRLAPRLEAIKEANEMFGLNLSLDVNKKPTEQQSENVNLLSSKTGGSKNSNM